MKQTAVEWLVEKIQQANPTFKFDALIREAKAMDKAERAKEYLRGFEDGKEYMKKIKTFKSE